RWSPPEMTFPSVTSDLLMFPPSFSRTPEAPVASARSLPARSTRWILLTTRRSLRPADTRPWDWPTPPTCVKLMVKMAWERLLTSFMPVLAVVRLMFPASISSSTSPYGGNAFLPPDPDGCKQGPSTNY
uniref:Uncharacterized protein n=1 Tax=Poecilia mexicana TaxID=48701 RepID=A0A3B3YHM9_9TELE